MSCHRCCCCHCHSPSHYADSNGDLVSVAVDALAEDVELDVAVVVLASIDPAVPFAINSTVASWTSGVEMMTMMKMMWLGQLYDYLLPTDDLDASDMYVVCRIMYHEIVPGARRGSRYQKSDYSKFAFHHLSVCGEIDGASLDWSTETAMEI